jgi:hypothetical protein
MTNILDFNHVSIAAVGFGPGKNETEKCHASTYRTSVFGDGFDDNDPFDLEKKDFLQTFQPKKHFLGTFATQCQGALAVCLEVSKQSAKGP